QTLAAPISWPTAMQLNPRFDQFAWHLHQHSACRTKTRTRTRTKTRTRTENWNENPELRTLNPEPRRGRRYTSTNEVCPGVRDLRLERKLRRCKGASVGADDGDQLRASGHARGAGD